MVYLRDHKCREDNHTEWESALLACGISLKHRGSVARIDYPLHLSQSQFTKAIIFLHADPEIAQQWIDAVVDETLKVRALVLVSTRGIRMPNTHPKVFPCSFPPHRFKRSNKVVAKFLKHFDL